LTFSTLAEELSVAHGARLFLHPDEGFLFKLSRRAQWSAGCGVTKVE
jgi:hypothetical protein